MADTPTQWLAKVNEQLAKRKGWILAIRNEAAQDMVDFMQTPVTRGGHMPYRDGYLSASLQAVIGEAPTFREIAPPVEGQKYSWDSGEVALVLATAEIDEKVTFGFVANYARRQNYGFHGADSLGRVYNQAGHLFVQLAAQRWPQFVEAAASRAVQSAVAGYKGRLADHRSGAVPLSPGPRLPG